MLNHLLGRQVVFLFATIPGAFRPVDRATSAHPGIAKLLAMLFPASPFEPAEAVKNRS